MRESEQLFVPFEEIYEDERIIEYLSSISRGLFPVELSIESLLAIAINRGYSVRESENLEIYGLKQEVRLYTVERICESSVFNFEDDIVFGLGFYTMPKNGMEAVFIVEPQLERFKDFYLDNE